MLILFTKEKALAEFSYPLNIKVSQWEEITKDGDNNKEVGIKETKEIKVGEISKDHHQIGTKETKAIKVGEIKDQTKVGEISKAQTKDGEISKDQIKDGEISKDQIKDGEINKDQTKDGETKDQIKALEISKAQIKVGEIKDQIKVIKDGETKEIKETKDGEMDGDRNRNKKYSLLLFIFFLWDNHS